jgi:hypothetical protein
MHVLYFGLDWSIGMFAVIVRVRENRNSLHIPLFTRLVFVYNIF